MLDGQIPEVYVEIDESDSTNPDATWTKIVILGYNDDDRKMFTHEQLKDYILWFTKMGSIEKEFGIKENQNVTLALRGVDRTEAEGYETLEFGHFFLRKRHLLVSFWKYIWRMHLNIIVKDGCLKKN